MGMIERVIWKTSTPMAPWQNGASERAVRTTIECLVLLTKKCRSMFELQKRFQRIENIINQRPVFQLDGKIFTAFELLNGRKVYASKECNDINIEELFKNRSKFEKEVHELWQRTLMKRLIDTKKPTVIQKGDWLLIPNHMKKRYQWSLGQVMDLMPGSDGVTRNDFFHKRSFVNN